MSAIKKGTVPNQIVFKGTFCKTPFITNKFMPTGGETKPNSTTNTAKIPNQIGSIPASTITGTLDCLIIKEIWVMDIRAVC